MKKILKLIALISFIAAIPALYFAYQYLVAPATVNDTTYELFIYDDYNADSIAERLFKDQVLASKELFLPFAAKKNLKNKNIVPGKYLIQPNWSYNKLINHLRAGNGRVEVKLSFHNVRTLNDLAGMMTKELRIDSLNVLNWLSHPDSIAKFGFNHYNILSMFIPDTYNVDWNISTPNLMRRVAKEYKRFWNEDRKTKANQIGMSQTEVYTLASIVYAETKYEKDIQRVAGVYMNRIHKGWPLQADPTLIFAAGDFSIKRVLNKHKEIDSPYNTYKNLGLPPGPINLPPKSYIEGVLNYERHDYMFFCAKEDFSGASNFSKTLEQHNRYAQKYWNALNKRKIFK